jgi:hypothetical protein
VFSLTTRSELYPRPAHQPAIRPSTKSLPFFLLMNSAPGTKLTSSSHKLYEAFVARGEVVISTFGGREGSRSEEK